MSLIIGLPYTIGDHFCDLDIAPLQTLGPGTWLYRHLGIITGRVIDHLQAQGSKSPALSSALAIEEQIADIISELPKGYLDMESIRECTDVSDKNTRLYRVVHIHLLRTYIHLPFFLLLEKEARYDFSRRSCIEESRQLLVAYLQIFDDDPGMAADGTVINFTAFTAAVVVLLGSVRYGQSVNTSTGSSDDLDLVLRTRDAIKEGATTKIAGRLCAKCCSALEELLLSARSSSADPHPIVLPYFGTLMMTSLPSDTEKTLGEFSHPAQMGTSSATGVIGSELGLLPYGGLDTSRSFTYQGPFMTQDDGSQWLYDPLPHGSMDWFGDTGQDTDWSWLHADLPPNTI